MKNILLIISALFLFSNFVMGQDASIDIKTAFHCPNGKALIEREMVKVDGVKTVVADINTKVVTVTYDAKKVNKEGLVAAIEKIGYTTEFTPENKTIKKACSHGENEEEHKHE
jgi:copper chaperone CopZ